MGRSVLVRVAVVALPASVLVGCGAPSGSPLFPFLKPAEQAVEEPKAEPRKGCATTAECAAHLKKLVAGHDRTWVGQRQPVEAYADGTRLFAYRVLKRRLTCEELRRAQAETRDLVPAMGAPEHAATRRLTQQVADELRAERLRRCRADAKR